MSVVALPETTVLSLVPKQSSLDEFLTDGEVGAVTGLSVLLAKTGRYDQIKEAPASIRPKLYIGYAATCITRCEDEKAEDLFDAYPEFWDGERIKRLYLERLGYTSEGMRLEGEPHKFTGIQYDNKGLRDHRKELIAKLETDEHMLDERLLNRYSPEEREKLKTVCRAIEFDLRRNLFGIELSYARMKNAMTQAAVLKQSDIFPGHVHTNGVVTYLESPTSDGRTGLQVINDTIKFNGINPVGWKIWVGTPKHPGRILHPIMATATETVWNLLGGVAAAGILYGGRELLREYSPETLQYLQSLVK
jgi:hypothetical protein